jgi:hypothetical protein
MKKQVVEPIVTFLAIIIVPKVSYKFVKPQSVPIFMNMSYNALSLKGHGPTKLGIAMGYMIIIWP